MTATTELALRVMAGLMAGVVLIVTHRPLIVFRLAIVMACYVTWRLFA